MGYLLAEIVFYLVIAGLIGFVVGFLVKGELQKRDVFSNDEEETSMINAQRAEVVEAESEVDATQSSVRQNAVPTLLSEPKKEGKDKLSTIKGIGPVLESRLNELGIYHFEQIASWTKEEEEWIGSQMSFPKRVTQEKWVKQAKELMHTKQ